MTQRWSVSSVFTNIAGYFFKIEPDLPYAKLFSTQSPKTWESAEQMKWTNMSGVYVGYAHCFLVCIAEGVWFNVISLKERKYNT